MSGTYMAYLCYPRLQMGDSIEDNEPEIKFEQPAAWKYEKILPIQFSVLHQWTDKDTRLYNG
jgi:hypothetical protein